MEDSSGGTMLVPTFVYCECSRGRFPVRSSQAESCRTSCWVGLKRAKRRRLLVANIIRISTGKPSLFTQQLWLQETERLIEGGTPLDHVFAPRRLSMQTCY